MARVFVCVNAHYLLSVLAQKVTQQLVQVWPSLCPPPTPPFCLHPPHRAAGYDIIDLWSGMGELWGGRLKETFFLCVAAADSLAQSYFSPLSPLTCVSEKVPPCTEAGGGTSDLMVKEGSLLPHVNPITRKNLAQREHRRRSLIQNPLCLGCTDTIF